MDKDLLTIHTAQYWFHRFENGTFELDDLPHTERTLQMDMDLLMQLIEEDLRLTTRCLSERSGCSYSAAGTKLYKSEKRGNTVFGYYMNYHRFKCSTESMIVRNYRILIARTNDSAAL